MQAVALQPNLPSHRENAVLPSPSPSAPSRRLPARGGRFIGLAALLGAIASQITYWQTWFYGRSVPFDAEMTFAPFYTAARRGLRAGQEVLGVRQDILGGYPGVSYAYANPLRLLAALLLPPDLAGVDAYVQVFHVWLSVFVFAGLLRTFAVPWTLTCLGGFMFMASGIHVSLAQHVYSQESLAYLGIVLLVTRVYCLRFTRLTSWERVALVCAGIVAGTTLARGVQDAVTYCIPCLWWVAVHGWAAHRRLSPGQRPALWMGLLGLGVGTALASIPQVVTWLEFAGVNRTQVEDYSHTGRYFADWRVFFAGLVFPETTGGTWLAEASRARLLNVDFTLSYIFAGHLCFSFIALYVAGLVRGRRWQTLGIYLGAVLLSLGYAFGQGSPIHYLLTHLFPPLGWLHHYYYGLHLFYGLSAFAAAVALARFLAKPRALDALLAVGAGLLVGGSLWAGIQFGEPIQGLLTSAKVYAERLDVQGIEFAFYHLALLILLLSYAKWVGIAGQHHRRKLAEAMLCGGLWLLVSVNLIRPAIGQEFTPGGTDMLVGTTREILSTLARQRPAPENSFRPPRILAVDTLWFSNLPLLVGCDTLKSGDTVGAKAMDDVVAALKAAPDAGTARTLAEAVGADYLWVRSWELRARLTAPEFTCLTQAAGALFRVNPALAPARIAGEDTERRLEISWWPQPGTVRRVRSLFGSSWEIDLKDTQREGSQQVMLPLQALRFFEVNDPATRQKLATGHDPVGRLVATAVHGALPERLLVRYPTSAISALLGASAVVYAGALGVMLATAMGTLARGLSNWKAASQRADATANNEVEDPPSSTRYSFAANTRLDDPEVSLTTNGRRPDARPTFANRTKPRRRWPWGAWTGCFGLALLFAWDGYRAECDGRQTATLEVSCQPPADASGAPGLFHFAAYDPLARAPDRGVTAVNTDVVGRCDYRFLMLLRDLRTVTLASADAKVPVPTVRRLTFFGPDGARLAGWTAADAAGSPGKVDRLRGEGVEIQWHGPGGAGPWAARLQPKLPPTPSAWRWVVSGTLAYGLGLCLACGLVHREVLRRGQTAFLECRQMVARAAWTVVRTREWQIVITCGLVATMAAASVLNRRQDGSLHRGATDFNRYAAHEPLPDRVGSLTATNLAPCLADALLFAMFAAAVSRRHALDPLAGLLLAAPPIWNVFSGADSDAFPLFLALLGAWQLGWSNSSLHGFLAEGRARWRVAISAGLVFGLLLSSKGNYRVLSVLPLLYAGWTLCVAPEPVTRRRLTWRWGVVMAVALAVCASRLTYDRAIQHFARPVLSADVKETDTRSGFPPPGEGRSGPAEGVGERSMLEKSLSVSFEEGLFGGRTAGDSWRGFTGLYRPLGLPGADLCCQLTKYMAFALATIFLLAFFKLSSRSEMILTGCCLGLMLLTVLPATTTGWIDGFQTQVSPSPAVVPLVGFLALRHPRAWEQPAVILLGGLLWAVGIYSFVSTIPIYLQT